MFVVFSCQPRCTEILLFTTFQNQVLWSGAPLFVVPGTWICLPNVWTLTRMPGQKRGCVEQRPWIQDEKFTYLLFIFTETINVYKETPLPFHRQYYWISIDLFNLLVVIKTIIILTEKICTKIKKIIFYWSPVNINIPHQCIFYLSCS